MLWLCFPIQDSATFRANCPARLDGVTTTGAGELLGYGLPGHRAETRPGRVFLVAVWAGKYYSWCYSPNSYGAITRPANQQAPIRREGYAVYITCMPFQRAQLLPSATRHKITVLSLDPLASKPPSGEKAIHKITVESFDPLASKPPSGEKATLDTQIVCPASVCSWLPSATRHKITVPSYDPLASMLPSGEKATLDTPLVCPASVRSWPPSDTRHKITVLSADPLASKPPSGEKATLYTRSVCPSRVRSWPPSDTRHKITVLSR
jgi:hypothetical protein